MTWTMLHVNLSYALLSFSFPVNNHRKVTSNETLVAVAFLPGADKQLLDIYHGPFIENDPDISHVLLRSTMLYEISKT